VSRNCWWEQLRCTPQTFGTTYLQQQPNPALRCVGPMVPDACAMILWAKQVFYALLLRRGCHTVVCCMGAYRYRSLPGCAQIRAAAILCMSEGSAAAQSGGAPWAPLTAATCYSSFHLGALLLEQMT